MSDRISLDLLSALVKAESKGRADRLFRVYVEFTCDIEALRQDGFELHAPLSGSARARLTAAQIRSLAGRDDVLSVSLPTKVTMALDKSVPEIRADAAWAVTPVNAGFSGKGAGVFVAILDSGIDVFHGAFRDSTGKSRILHLWDQTFEYDTNGDPVDDDGELLEGDALPKDENDTPVYWGTRDSVEMKRTPADSGDPALASLDYGIEFDNHQIDTALTLHPDGRDLSISLRDDGSQHGTHVAGTAAGNGLDPDKCTEAGTYVGVAPEADLIIVKMGFEEKQKMDWLAALDYALAKARAAGKPVAVNMSFGGHWGQHNGLSYQSRRLDKAINGTTGEVIVKSAGNERHEHIHAAFTIPESETKTLRFEVPSKTKKVNIFASYDPISQIMYRLRWPPKCGNVRDGNLTDPAVSLMSIRHGHEVATGPVSSHPGDEHHIPDPDRHFEVEITRQNDGKVASGIWEFEIDNGAPGAAHIHLWFVTGAQWLVPEDESASPQTANYPEEWQMPENWLKATLGMEATTDNALTVAAYDPNDIGREIYFFSSQGPVPFDLIDGIYPTNAPRKPDIAAPGVGITAPMADARRCWLQCECCVGRYHDMVGTSMAAPHVTGVVALMLAQDPLLAYHDVKYFVLDTARSPINYPADWPSSRELFGAGRIDAEACVQAAKTNAEGRNPPAPSPPSPFIAFTPPPPPRRPPPSPIGLPGLLDDWEQRFGKRPAWQLFAALVSRHFDEVKRLINTNRRVSAIWVRHGGPDLVRGAVFGTRALDPPLPERIGDRPSVELIERLLKTLTRYGGTQLRADIARYGDFARALPGRELDEIDALLARETP